MGLHYVPRLYLRGFADAAERLWAFDRAERRHFFSTIDNVGQESKFYPDDLERIFCSEVESPAAPVFHAIRKREEIYFDDKEVLAKYLAAQLKRVPAGKKLYHAVFPAVAKEILSGVSSRIDILVEEDPALEGIGRRRKAKVDELLDRASSEPPNEIWCDTIRPEYLETIAGAIRTMSWRFFYIRGAGQFLTSDNPVFFFSRLGLGGENSELSFPIAHDIVMCADRRSESDLRYFEASSQLAKEVNRRTISVASRYVYARENESWVASFSLKDHKRLNSIR